MKRNIVILLLSALSLSLYAIQNQLPKDSLVALGAYYYKAQRYVDALDVLGEAMDKADQAGDERAYVYSLMTIGNIYTIFDDYEQALHCYTVCLDKAKAIEDTPSMAKLQNNMLLCYAMLGKYREAEACYRSIPALGMGDEHISRFYSYLNQALLSKARNYHKGAIYFHTQALKYAQSHNMSGIYIAAEMGQIGGAYQDSGDMAEAEKWYLDCFDFSEKGQYVGPLTTSCERLADLYREQGKDDLYVKYTKLYAKYSDSLFSQKDFNSKRTLVSNYESRMKDRHLSMLRDKNQTLVWVIVTIAVLMAALTVLLIYIYKVNRRLVATQKLLIKKHQEHSLQLEVQNELFASLRDNEHKVNPPSETVEHVDVMAEKGEMAENSNAKSAEMKAEKPECADADADAGICDGDADLLSKKQMDLLLMAISRVMEDTDTVCNPDFCLATLAQMVGSNTKYVSWVINKSYGKNFKTYLNEYRIRTASKLLLDTDKFANLTIAGIAERVGYKSPASFHQAFKKVYAMTPAAYVKLVKRKDE